jgi:hypothetical protein
MIILDLFLQLYEEKLVLIPLSDILGRRKKGTCSHMQIPISLAWAITVHKSQGITLKNAVVEIGKEEYAAGLIFVAISRVCSLKNILIGSFSFKRLKRIKKM